MTAKLEVLRDFAHWVEVGDLGTEPFEIRSNVSLVSERYVIVPDKDGRKTVIFIFSWGKDDLAIDLSDTSKNSVLDLKTKPLKPGCPELIEGVLPGNTKPELFRISQE